MCHIKISRQKYPLHRFLELFMPTVLNFSFWLASAAFWFFAYQSISPNAKEATVSLAQQILPNVFLWLGYFCLLVLVYIFFTWISGIRIARRKPNQKEIDDIKNEIAVLTKRLHDLETEVGKVEGEGTTKIE